MTGEILASERPARRIMDGDAWASEMAVSAPILLVEGPVMRIILPSMRQEKCCVTEMPVLEREKADIVVELQWVYCDIKSN